MPIKRSLAKFFFVLFVYHSTQHARTSLDMCGVCIDVLCVSALVYSLSNQMSVLLLIEQNDFEPANISYMAHSNIRIECDMNFC